VATLLPSQNTKNNIIELREHNTLYKMGNNCDWWNVPISKPIVRVLKLHEIYFLEIYYEIFHEKFMNYFISVKNKNVIISKSL